MMAISPAGQYLDGTTDVTRTMHYGQPTELQKEAYTRVLMGTIDLATTVVNRGTSDTQVKRRDSFVIHRSSNAQFC